MQDHWTTALRAFDEVSYDNRIGVTAHADRRVDLTASLAEHGLTVQACVRWRAGSAARVPGAAARG